MGKKKIVLILAASGHLIYSYISYLKVGHLSSQISTALRPCQDQEIRINFVEMYIVQQLLLDNGGSETGIGAVCSILVIPQSIKVPKEIHLIYF